MPPNNTAFNGVLDPATAPSGMYVYTVQAPAPCPSATAHVTVTVTPAPDAGDDATSALCSTNPPVNMLGLLDGTPDQGGTWTDPDGNPTTSTFAPGASQSGTYHYAVSAVASCPEDRTRILAKANKGRITLRACSST